MDRSPFALAACLTLLVPTASAQPRESAQASVVAELIERGPATPHCGIVHFVVPMRYRLTTVTRGPASVGQELFVAVSCPELTGARFVVGARHSLTLSTRRPWRSGSLVPWAGHPAPSRIWWAVIVRESP